MRSLQTKTRYTKTRIFYEKQFTKFCVPRLHQQDSDVFLIKIKEKRCFTGICYYHSVRVCICKLAYIQGVRKLEVHWALNNPTETQTGVNEHNVKPGW